MGFCRIFLIVCAFSIPTVNCVSINLVDILLKSVENNVSKNISVAQSGNNSNDMCQRHFDEFLSYLVEGKINWAWIVADSWGKLPSGIISGNLADFGSFAQCLSTRYEIAPGDIFQGKYCLSNAELESFQIPSPLKAINEIYRDSLPRVGPIAPVTGFRIGVCIPDECSADFISPLINDILVQYVKGLNITISENSCYRNESKIYSGLDIFAIFFFSTFLALLILSTAYDIIMVKSNQIPNSMLIAFSIYTNGQKIFKCKKSNSADIMDCLNGIRVFSIMWIVFGHSYFMYLMVPMSNFFILVDWMEYLYSMMILGGTVAVDTFFFISGLLVTWSTLRHFDKTNGRINVFTMYLHRYLRLTPALAAAMLFYVTLLKHIGNGPIWNNLVDDTQKCDQYWWSTLLYVQNYVNSADICLGHSWYLSVDMQLFILSPLILYPLWRWKNKFVGVIVLLILISIACTFTVILINNAFRSETGKVDVNLRMQKTYFGTHNRMGAWLVGVLLGYFMHVTKNHKISLNKWFIILCWLLSLIGLFGNVFAVYPMFQISPFTTAVEYAFQESFSRVTWAIAIAWVVFACVRGFGGPINWFLSLPHWQPISRISYSLYIVHFPFQLIRAHLARNSQYFSDFTTIHQFVGDFGIALILAFIWSMAFESPVVIIEKFIFGQKSNSSRRNNEIVNGNTTKF